MFPPVEQEQSLYQTRKLLTGEEDYGVSEPVVDEESPAGESRLQVREHDLDGDVELQGVREEDGHREHQDDDLGEPAGM